MKETKTVVNAEEVIFYIDLTSDFFKKKVIIKSIKDFIEDKIKLSDSSFGIVIFQEEDNPIALYDRKDADSVINIIEEKWESRTKSQSNIENGLFEILSYVFMKCRQSQRVFRIIVISDTPSKRPDEYHNAVYDLIMKAKKFSIIIDVIRTGRETIYDDEVKLKVITSETEGGTFICNNIQQFNDVLYSLVKSKKEFNIIRSEEVPVEYLAEDKIFYERLAVDLISLSPNDEEICSICGLALCPICGAYSDEIHKCFNCNSKFHGCCIAKYAISNNFGYKHILRCPKCETLLKLDADYVNLVFEEELSGQKAMKIQEEPKETPNQLLVVQQEEISHVHAVIEKTPEEIKVQIQPQEKNIENISINLETLPPPPSRSMLNALSNRSSKVLSNHLPIAHPSPPPSPPPLKKVRVGGYFGQDIVIDENLKKNKLIIKENVASPKSEEKLSITSLTPPKKKTTLKFCKICGNSVKDVICCPNCGAKID